MMDHPMTTCENEQLFELVVVASSAASIDRTDLINNNDIKLNKNAAAVAATESLANPALQAAKLAFNRANGTPKRRLSYNNSTPTMMETTSSSGAPSMATIPEAVVRQASVLKSPSGGAAASNGGSNSTSTTPFIKRKCLSKEMALKENACSNASPFVIQSVKMDSTSPKLLNDSFETLKLNNMESGSGSRQTARYLSRRSTYSFSKHKSAPLSRLAFGEYFSSVCESSATAHANAIASIKSSPLSISANILPANQPPHHQPLNNIINQIHTRTSASYAGGLKMLDDNSFSEEQNDHITDLENLIFGNGSQPTSSNVKKTVSGGSDQLHNHQHFIKQSLDNDAAGKNLIGDKTREHILPVVTSNKHSDLHCISPDTLVELLNGQYDDQIDEYIIVDSRYPYEYEGGHIANALNIYTKDKLIEELFFKRLHFKQMRKKITSSMSSSCLTSAPAASRSRDSDRMDYDDPEQQQRPEPNSNPSNGADIKNAKRVIIIFHCEFSSERGPTLLKFLRNQDRILNENIYPHLFYPELYLLEGGYKSFYEHHKNYCEPQTYKPMLHSEHVDDYKHFRAKAKSWEISRHHLVLKEHLHQLTNKKSELDGSHLEADEEMTDLCQLNQEQQQQPLESQQQQQHLQPEAPIHRHPVIKMRTKIA